MAHTPAPWIIPYGGICPTVTTADERELIATMGDTGDRAEANAALIAAAPDLLAALEGLLGLLDAGSLFEPQAIAARAAISKATA